MAALDRAVALAVVHAVPVAVEEHLDLDVPRPVEVALEVDAAVSEGGLRLARGGSEGALHLLGGPDDADALAPASRRRLERGGVADPLRRRRGPRGVLDRVDEPGDAGDVGLLHDPAAGDLVPHRLDRRGRGPDPRQPGLLDAACELRVLGQEPVARVDRLRLRPQRGGDDLLDVEVALARQRPAEPHGHVREPRVQGGAVEVRVDADGLDAHLARCTHDAECDLAAVGDEDAAEGLHSGMFPCFLAGRVSTLVFRSSSPRIRVGRVAWASITSSTKPRSAAM